MHTSKLFTLIGGLDPAEFRWLHKFVKSPFYNTNEKVLQLFLYIKKYYPDLAAPKLTKEVAFQYLFPKQKFSAQKMRKLMHELATLVEDFMVAQHFQKNQFERKKVLTKELGQRNIYGLFEKHTNEITAELDSLPYRDREYYLDKYLNDYQIFAHPSTNPRQDFIPKLFQLSDALDQFYFLQKLQLNSVSESAKYIYSVKEKLPFYDSITQEIKNKNLDKIPVFQLYLLVIQLFKAQDAEKVFNQLYDSFFSKKDNLREMDKVFILKYLINYSISKINGGDKTFASICFKLYKFGLNNDLLTISNTIPEKTFGNIVSTGCLLKEFPFVAEFIEKYKIFIDGKRRITVVVLNKANLLFNSRNYIKTIDLLLTHTFLGVLDKIRAKTLLIKSYFELYQEDSSYYNLLYTQIENFERNIRREEKISNLKKGTYINFTKSLKELIKLKSKRLDMTSYRTKIQNANGTSNKAWLLEKTGG